MARHNVVAIAGAGDSARYLVAECQANGVPVHVISRAPREWFSSRGIQVHVSDYAKSSLLGILSEIKATLLVSLLHDNNPNAMVPAQAAMLSACQASEFCKRFIPSEMGGDIHPDAFPTHPLFYVPTHIPIREALAKQDQIEYTLFCIGWFGDYWHLPADGGAEWKSYMKDLRPVWPVDSTKRTIRINGDGTAPVTFTAARDVAAAMVRLFEASSWEPYTYVAGETSTWSELAKRLPGLYGVPFEVEHRSIEDIQQTIEREEAALKKDVSHPTSALWLAYMDLWNANGAAGLPYDKVKVHREKYFPGLHFKPVQEIVERGRELQGKEEIL